MTLTRKKLIARINDRRYKEAMYIITTHCTTRECAREFKVDQATVVRDMRHPYIKDMYPMVYKRIREVFHENLTTHRKKRR